ncbi:MAG: hypothetical protein ACM319_07780 [Deltaproteobacteria bacterium]
MERPGTTPTRIYATRKGLLEGSWRTGAMLAAGIALAALAGCTSSPAPEKPLLHTTKAFDAIFGELPPMTVPGPCYGTVAYFPSLREPGKYRPLPIFSAEQGKEERLTVRTVIRGVDADGLAEEIDFPFPRGSDLDSLAYEGGVVKIRLAGTFPGAGFSGKRAAEALALTVAQFGKAATVEVTDAAGRVAYTGRADRARTADVGSPKTLGVIAIREEKNRPPSVLSVLFDRPVFIEDISIYPPGGKTAYPGKSYSTGFGMSVELHPEPKVDFDPDTAYHVRMAVRDGKGRRTKEERDWKPKAVTRDG